MENINGDMCIILDIPCCNDEKLEIKYKTKDNKFVASVFRLITERIGIDVKLSDVTIRKGGGG